MTKIKDLGSGINQALTNLYLAGLPPLSCKKSCKGRGHMLSKLARVGFLLFMAVMVLSWAVTASRSKPAPVDLPDDRFIGTLDC